MLGQIRAETTAGGHFAGRLAFIAPMMPMPFLRRLLLPLSLGLALLAVKPAAGAGPPQQAYRARQFLLAVLAGQYERAYQLLAPETRQRLTPPQFAAAAAPLYQRGQQAGPAIELYRLGLRLGEADDAQWFYAFTFRSDSAAAAPVQLDVTFRDSAATQVLDFGLLPGRVRGQ